MELTVELVGEEGVSDLEKAIKTDETMCGREDVNMMQMPKDAKWEEISRLSHPKDSVVKLGDDVEVGKGICIIAGPCAVESYEQLLSTAKFNEGLGIRVLRGGVDKPRTSPKDFQGLGEEGLRLLARVKEETGMLIATEITSEKRIPLFERYGVDIYQVGARNCQNFELLKALSQIDKPVIIKRGSGVTVDEFLNAANYIYTWNGGNKRVILCERGDKTPDPAFRNVMNINNIAYIRQVCHIPIIGDPSHSTGYRELVTPIALASIAAGAQGLIVEVHCDPDNARCDGRQSLTHPQMEELYRQATELYGMLRGGKL